MNKLESVVLAASIAMSGVSVDAVDAAAKPPVKHSSGLGVIDTGTGRPAPDPFAPRFREDDPDVRRGITPVTDPFAPREYPDLPLGSDPLPSIVDKLRAYKAPKRKVDPEAQAQRLLDKCLDVRGVVGEKTRKAVASVEDLACVFLNDRRDNRIFGVNDDCSDLRRVNAHASVADIFECAQDVGLGMPTNDDIAMCIVNAKLLASKVVPAPKPEVVNMKKNTVLELAEDCSDKLADENGDLKSLNVLKNGFGKLISQQHKIDGASKRREDAARKAQERARLNEVRGVLRRHGK